MVTADGLTRSGSLIDEIVRAGARRMPAAAPEAEVDQQKPELEDSIDEGAQAGRRAVTGAHPVASVRAGTRFEDGRLVERAGAPQRRDHRAAATTCHEGTSMQPARVRTAAYVTRDVPGGRELLVFDHRDHPEAGTQVPAGGVDPGEPLVDAVLREVTEETGVTAVTLGAALAVQQRPHPHTGRPRVTVFFHAQTTETRDTWTHTVAGQGDDQDHGMVFRCYFVPMREAAGLLADDQGEFMPLVETSDIPTTTY
ncbi:NUDIX domain-containing protein [Kitasatospora sp. NPDC096077]|uniref:NUDIX hydrolase n=1 Tax=Kitasatospora sp. NPDC096077 TaxID=3155544 RepID=UPI00331D1937